MNADARVFWKCVSAVPLCSSLILTGLSNLRASLISVFFFNGFPFLFFRFQFPLLYLWIHWLCFLPTQTCYWIPIVGQIFPLGILFRGPFFLIDYLFIHFEPVSQISPDGLELSGYPVMTLDSPQQSFFLRLPWAGIVGITSKHNWVSYLFVGMFMFMALCPWFFTTSLVLGISLK